MGREVEFRFSQWRCAFVFHWVQKGEFELEGKGQNGMEGNARRRKSSCLGLKRVGRGLLLWSALD